VVKAILEFTMPEEREDHQLAFDGWKWKGVTVQMYNKLRSMEKHQERDILSIQEVRNMLNELVEDNDLIV
jgi:hypothetical protein